MFSPSALGEAFISEAAASADFTEALGPGIDAVIISSPNHWHRAQAIAIMEDIFTYPHALTRFPTDGVKEIDGPGALAYLQLRQTVSRWRQERAAERRAAASAPA